MGRSRLTFEGEKKDFRGSVAEEGSAKEHGVCVNNGLQIGDAPL
jgi:hypothetical protein